MTGQNKQYNNGTHRQRNRNERKLTNGILVKEMDDQWKQVKINGNRSR